LKAAKKTPRAKLLHERAIEHTDRSSTKWRELGKPKISVTMAVDGRICIFGAMFACDNVAH
jgi:hypothetical protein